MIKKFDSKLKVPNERRYATTSKALFNTPQAVQEGVDLADLIDYQFTE